MPVIVSTSGSLHSEFVWLLFLQDHQETDRFFSVSGVQFPSCTSGSLEGVTRGVRDVPVPFSHVPPPQMCQHLVIGFVPGGNSSPSHESQFMDNISMCFGLMVVIQRVWMPQGSILSTSIVNKSGIPSFTFMTTWKRTQEGKLDHGTCHWGWYYTRVFFS